MAWTNDRHFANSIWKCIFIYEVLESDWTQGRNSVTAWTVVPVLQVTIVPVPIRSDSAQPPSYNHKKGFTSKIRWSVYGLRLSQITRWTILRLPDAFQTATGRLSRDVSWPPLVTIVPVLQRHRSRLGPATVTAVPVTQTREIVTLTLWALCLYTCCLTGIYMLMKEITRYRDPSVSRMEALVHVRHIYIETRLYVTRLH